MCCVQKHAIRWGRIEFGVPDVAEKEKKKQGFVIAVMAVVAVAFAAPVILPLVGALSGGTPVASSPTASASPNAYSPDELNKRITGYQAVLQREPENTSALKGLIEAQIAKGDNKAAIAPLEKLVTLTPDEPGIGVLLAKVKERTGDLEGSAQTYRQFLQKKPADVLLLTGLRDLLLQQQRPEAAIALLQDTLRNTEALNRQTPGSVTTEALVSMQLLLGETFAKQDRFNEAIASYDKAIQADNQDFRPLVAKALVMRADGKEDEAKKLFVLAAALTPDQYKDMVNKMAAQQNPAAAASPGSPNPAASAVTSPASPAASPTASPSN
jgi:Flp pilus assembly protein TadD